MKVTRHPTKPVSIRIDVRIDGDIVEMKIDECRRVGAGRHAYMQRTAGSERGEYRLSPKVARELGATLMAAADTIREFPGDKKAVQCPPIAEERKPTLEDVFFGEAR